MREVILFFVFTATGLWVINNSVVHIVTTLLPAGWSEFWRINIAKGLATTVSGVWHYLMYKYIVFRTDPNIAFKFPAVG